jgi:hypothetical protein
MIFYGENIIMNFLKIPLIILVVTLFLAASIIQPSLALTEGSSTGTAHVGSIPPTISQPILWNEAETVLKNGTALAVDTPYCAHFTVIDTNGLASINYITYKIWDSTVSSENASDAESNHYTFTWTESTDTWTSSPAGFVHPADSETPGIGSTLTTFEYGIEFDLSKVAKNTIANSDWKIKITVVDDSADAISNSELMFGVALYREIVVSDVTHGWANLSPGDTDHQIDIPGNRKIDFIVVSNDNWLIQAKGSGALTSGANTIPLSNVKINKDTLGSATSLTTSYANVVGLTNNSPPTNEIGTASNCTLWITVPLGTPTGDYTYTLNLQILQQT